MISINESLKDFFGKPTGLLDPLRRNAQDVEMDSDYAVSKGIAKAVRNTKDIATFWKAPDIQERFRRDAAQVSRDVHHFGKKGYLAIKRAFEDDPVKLTAALAVAAGLGYLGVKGLRALKDKLIRK